jgi:serine/threonine protein kinase
MAPEIELGRRHGQKQGKYKMSKADVFSLGITFLQVLTMENLDGLNIPERYYELMHIVRRVQLPWARDMLVEMLQVDPAKRAMFRDLTKYINCVYTSRVED